jgi:zinc protease
MEGGSTPQDLEAMFQLLYLRFTQPRADPTAFAAMASQAKAMLANRMASPDVAFDEAVNTALSSDNPRRRSETSATVDQWDLKKAMTFYKARFADASRFTFVFVGSFTIDSIKPLVEKYLASLPATHGTETYRDLGITAPRGVVTKTVQQGIDPKAQVSLVFSGPFEYDDRHRLALRTTALLLEGRLVDTIRQQLGGTYSITTVPDTDRFPKPQYTVRIDWTCDPARTESLVSRVFQEVEFVKNTRLGPEQMALVRQTLQRQYEADSQDNRWFLSEISRAYEDGTAANLAASLDMPKRIAALTADDIHEAAVTYLDAKNYVRVTLLPAAK